MFKIDIEYLISTNKCNIISYIEGKIVMDYIGLGFNKNDEEMRQLIYSTISADEVVSQQISGVELAVALISFAGFTLQFAQFVLENILPSEKENLHEREDERNNIKMQRVIIIHGAIITQMDIIDGIGEEWTAETVLQALNKIEEESQNDSR